MKLATVETFKILNNKNQELKQLTGEQLKKLQNILLEILVDIDFVCKKYNLIYNLGGGSCLGAIRHNGFIPWDDDVDINMPRGDYEKFCNFFMKEFGDKYWLHTPEKTKDLGMGFARVRKKGTIFRSREDLTNEKEAGIYIDIFIIENTYNFKPMRYLHGFLSLLFGFLLSCRNFYKNRKFYLEIVRDNKKITRTFRVKILIGFLLAWLSVDKMTTIWNNINKMCKNDNSEYVTVPVGRKHFFGELYKREEFCQVTLHEFEKKQFYVCKEYDNYLKHMYGDYMQIPKDADKETHIFLELKLNEQGDN